MEKFELDNFMVDSVEYMRNQQGMSFYMIISAIVNESNSDLFNGHSKKISRYFNEFDEREDDENFLKCFLGHYEVKHSRFKIICPSCSKDDVSIYSASIECNNCDFIEST